MGRVGATGLELRTGGSPYSLGGIRQELRRLGVRPRKALGQNFLVDHQVLARILKAAEVGSADEVLEVGPGLGALTGELAERARRVVAVELDRRLAERLGELAQARPHLEVVNADILALDLSQYFRPRQYKVVANLPYYITSAALRHFLQSPCPPALLVVMVQREVAQRIVARPGQMSLLSVSVQFFGHPRLVGRVPARAFYPPPKVESALVRVDVYERPAVEAPVEGFFRLVHAGFAQPRKQLRNSLAQGAGLPPPQAEALLREAGLDERRRPGSLALAEWGRLWETFHRHSLL